MSKRHLKSIAAPKSWPIKRKEQVFVIRPNPGAHKIENAMPIGLVLKLLSQVKNSKEAKQVINERKVLVNKKPVKDIKSQAGLFDIIEFADKHYRIILNKKGLLSFNEIGKQESNILLYKLAGKTRIKNNKIQLNFHNGVNLLVEKDNYQTNDVLIIEDKKVKDKITFEKGSIAYIIKGKNVGKIARIEEIYNTPPFNKQVTVSIADKKINLPKDYIFLVGKTKPIIELSEK
ncbi:MAG: 30S ribosomal protein S4e [Nanoarchaeota archaeon]